MKKVTQSDLIPQPIKTVYQNRHEHLRDLLARHGGPTRVAETIGVSKQQMSHVGSETPIKNIGDRFARRVEAAFGLPIGSIDQPLGITAIDIDEFSVVIPMLNVTASMGPGAAPPWAEEVIYSMRVSKLWIRQNTQATSFERLATITAKGDSMAPTFRDGDTLLVDTSITHLKLDAVFVLERSGELFIKRVQRNIDGTYVVKSDNPQYSPQQIDDPMKAGLSVLGRVLLSWNVNKL